MSRWLPLLGVIAFLGMGGLVRLVLHWRRYGTWGVMLFRARESGQLVRDGLASVLFLLMVIQAAAVALRPHRLESLYLFPPFVRLGAVVMFTGAAVMFLAQGHMGTSWRIGIDEGADLPLVATGLYRACRHPIFSAILLTLLGFMLLVPTLMSVVMFAGAMIGIRRQAVAEERYLMQMHGDAYRRYARQVGRFMPWVGRLQ
jgi:protein-S-isoprenylcysteine O-methyltransferase Ste14